MYNKVLGYNLLIRPRMQLYLYSDIKLYLYSDIKYN